MILEINKVQHVKWCMNKRKLSSDISNRFLPSSVSRAWDWWFGGCEFKPRWGQFLMRFILCCVTLDLSDNLTENVSDRPNVKNCKVSRSDTHLCWLQKLTGSRLNSCCWRFFQGEWLLHTACYFGGLENIYNIKDVINTLFNCLETIHFLQLLDFWKVHL